MDFFNYRNSTLYAEDTAISEIAKSVGTPFYCYSQATLERHFNVFSDGFSDRSHLICFAVKANSNMAVLRVLGALGAGGDCVSAGEIRRCIEAGIPANKIVFSGVGKTREEMQYALSQGIMQFNVESESELIALNSVAVSMGVQAPIAFRVNPDVDANTHDKIATGRKEDKFGIAIDDALALYQEAAKLDGIKVQAVATHIGSQLTSLEPMRAAFERVAELVRTLQTSGFTIERIDLGGGLGIPYDQESPPLPNAYAAMVKEVTSDLNCQLVFEPGRLIAGNAGILVTEIIYVKDTGHRKFLIVDAAMNDLSRPTMYDAYHEIIPVQQSDASKAAYDVVGPVCETGDYFAKLRPIASQDAGALLAIRSSGAYGAVMSSEYNTRPLIPEVLVNGEDFAVIRQRPTFEEMTRYESTPSWLA